MATPQPVTTDNLNNPDHSLMHRQIAADTSATVKSIEVLSTGQLKLPYYTTAGALTNNTSGEVSTVVIGTGANNILQLNGSSQIPAVSGALLTNLPATTLASTTSQGTSYSAGSVYQNTSSFKHMIIAKTNEGGTNGGVAGFIGATSSPATKVAYQEGGYRHGGSITFICPPTWYWKCTDDGYGVGLQRIEVWEV